ncbi:MAG: PRC-barrel domain-containing protein [Candidatus Pacearchaeota archaeon]|nr:PRC-barrel domain-containing protein [Candidatus Pacearchaeota archaeon]
MTNTTINYNITLRVVNKGGSDATSSLLTDSDSTSSPYDLTTVSANSSVLRNYLKEYTRNSTTYNLTLATATVNATDPYSGNEISANSSEMVLIIPSSPTGQQLTLVKNAYYNSENSTAVNYTLTVDVVNSGGTDLTSISLIDNDLDINTNINLNRTQNYSTSGSVIVSKAASNTLKTFVKASATVNSVTYQSNQIQVSIPGYGGPADLTVYAPASVQTSTSFDTTIEIENQNIDIGQDFITDYWITNVAEDTNYSSGQQTVYVGASGTSNITATLTSPSSAGTYRYKALTTWTGGTASAFDSFTVTAPSSDTGTGGSSGGGGGSITGDAIQEVICNPPYMRYGLECCLDANNNSICDKDEEKWEKGENKTSQENQTGGEIEKPEKQSQFNEYIKNIGKFFSSIIKQVSKNKIYFFIGFGALILVSIIFLTIKFLIKRKPKDLTRLKSIKGIKVYGADGHKIGKVKEIYLEEKKPRIYGWLIKVDKNTAKKIKNKNILVKHKHVESIKHIMIIDKRVSEHLEKLDSDIK